jgi:hypothetical protein
MRTGRRKVRVHRGGPCARRQAGILENDCSCRKQATTSGVVGNGGLNFPRNKTNNSPARPIRHGGACPTHAHPLRIAIMDGRHRAGQGEKVEPWDPHLNFPRFEWELWSATSRQSLEGFTEFTGDDASVRSQVEKRPLSSHMAGHADCWGLGLADPAIGALTVRSRSCLGLGGKGF